LRIWGKGPEKWIHMQQKAFSVDGKERRKRGGKSPGDNEEKEQ